MGNHNEVGHPKTSVTISIHNKCKPTKTAYKRQSSGQIFFKEENSICMLFKKRHAYKHIYFLAERAQKQWHPSSNEHTWSPDLGF